MTPEQEVPPLVKAWCAFCVLVIATFIGAALWAGIVV